MNFGNEFWATVVGAIVGGVIAALIQLITLWMASRERKRAELTLRQGQARSLLFKAVKVYLDFRILRAHADMCQAKALEEGRPFGWMWFVAGANFPRPVEFTPEEMGTLLACKDNDLFNDLASLDGIHNGLIESLRLYRDRRAALTDQLPAQMQGMVGTIHLDDQMLQVMGPKAAELDQMARDIVESIDRNVDEEFEVAGRLTSAFNGCYSLGITITPLAIDEVQAPIAEPPAQPAA